MNLRRVALLVGPLLVLGFVLSLRASFPGLFPATTAPIPPGELWQLNHQ